MRELDLELSPLNSPSFTRSTSERIRRRAARVVATCAMGAWFLLAVVPFLVVICEIR